MSGDRADHPHRSVDTVVQPGMRPLLVLRPQPGWDRTAKNARALGWTVLGAPLFAIRPINWKIPARNHHDALMLTSANAVRHAGTALASLTQLPCYVVGRSTAEAARQAGLRVVHVGAGNADALARAMREDGVARALHLCGRDHHTIAAAVPAIDSIPVYVAEPTVPLPAAISDAITQDPIVLLHSARAAGRFADLAGPRRSRLDLAVLSPAVLAAAGGGWRRTIAAVRPEESALLAAAFSLCDGGQMAAAAQQ